MKKKIIITSLVVLGAAALILYTNATQFVQGVGCDEFVRGYYSHCSITTPPQGAASRQYFSAWVGESPVYVEDIPQQSQACPFSYSDTGVEKFGGFGRQALEYRYVNFGPNYIMDEGPQGHVRPGVVLRKNNQYCLGLDSQDIIFPLRNLSVQENIKIQKALRSLAGVDNGDYTQNSTAIQSGLGICSYHNGHLECPGLSGYLYDYFRNVNIPNAQQFCTKAYNCLLGRAPDSSGLNACVNDVNQNRANLFAANMASSSEFRYSLRYRLWMNGDLTGCTASNPPPNPPPPAPTPTQPPPNSCTNGYWRLSACNNQCSHSCVRRTGCGNKWYCQ